MIEERKRLEAVLEDFRAFLPGKVHSEYKASTAADLEAIETRILEDDITSISDLFTLVELRATRRVLKANLTSFEDTVATLESRISQLKADEVNPNATQQEPNLTDEPEEPTE